MGIKHIIIGAGVVGQATGVWLKANGYDVQFYDIDINILQKMKEKGYDICKDLIKTMESDIIWICTAEWDVEQVINDNYKTIENNIIIIRSTMKPGVLKDLEQKYKLEHMAHIPEFLRQKTATQDIFNNSRIIVGTKDTKAWSLIKKVFEPSQVPIIHTSLIESSIIKYAANNWLAMQISFWNEIKLLTDSYTDTNPQLIAKAVTIDPRISEYGSAMIKEPFAGFCFPKDTKALQEMFKEQNISENMITAMIKTNTHLTEDRVKK